MPSSGDGTGWNEALPDDSDLIEDAPTEMRDIRVGVRIRLEKEHVLPAASSVGGEHKAGSAVVYADTSEPTLRPDGATALDADDAGRVLVRTDEAALYYWDGTQWVAVISQSELTDGSVVTGKLADGAVTTDKIADGAVTAAKLETGILTGQIGTLELADESVTTPKIAANAVTAAKLAINAVNTANIVDASVTAAKLAAGVIPTLTIVDGSVTTSKLADGAVVEAKLGSSAVTAEKLASSAVTSAKINPSAVTSTQLATDAVVSAKIQDGAVGTAKLADGAVTEAKLAASSVSTLKLALSAVATSRLDDAAVTLAKLGGGSVDVSKLVTSSKIGVLSTGTYSGNGGASPNVVVAYTSAVTVLAVLIHKFGAAAASHIVLLGLLPDAVAGLIPLVALNSTGSIPSSHVGALAFTTTGFTIQTSKGDADFNGSGNDYTYVVLGAA